MLDPAVVGPAAHESVRKLDPRRMARNPVMFVVEIGSALVTVLFVRDPGVFAGLIAIWLWFTVLFANVAEAMAEGRGKAQAAALRRTRSETIAHRRLADGSVEDVASSTLGAGDEVIVTYESTKTNGRRFRNTEILTFEGDKIRKAEVYYGWNLD